MSRDGDFMPPIWKMIKEYETRQSKIIYYKTKNKKIAFLKDNLEISPVGACKDTHVVLLCRKLHLHV